MDDLGPWVAVASMLISLAALGLAFFAYRIARHQNILNYYVGLAHLLVQVRTMKPPDKQLVKTVIERAGLLDDDEVLAKLAQDVFNSET